jgi:hypothetical protein
MPRSRVWLAAVVLVLGGCTNPTGVELPALLQFTLTPRVHPSEPPEPGVVERWGSVIVVEGTVSFTACDYMVPRVHGTPDDVRLDLTLEPTGRPCTGIPTSYLFSAQIGGVATTRDVRLRVRVLPGGPALLDTVLVPGYGVMHRGGWSSAT